MKSVMVRVDKSLLAMLREMQRELAIRTGKHYSLVEVSRMALNDRNFGTVRLGGRKR